MEKKRGNWVQANILIYEIMRVALSMHQTLEGATGHHPKRVKKFLSYLRHTLRNFFALRRLKRKKNLF